MAKEIYRFDEFELNPSRRSFTREGAAVTLSPKAFEVLAYLVANPGRLIPKEELFKAVWPESYVEENNLTQHISALRKAFAGRPGYIVTVPGRGYHFTALVHEERETDVAHDASDRGILIQHVREHSSLAVEETTVVAAEPAPQSTTRSSRFRRVAMWSGVAAVLALVAGGGFFAWQRFSKPQHYRRVLVGDFLGFPDRPDVAATLKSALLTELSQSPYIQLMGDGMVHSTLKNMGKAEDSPLLGDAALEVCRRSAYQALIRGRANNNGNGFTVGLDVVECSSGRTLGSFEAYAIDENAMLDSLDGLALKARNKLGEPRESFDAFRVPIIDGTTFSFDALEDYNTGSKLGNEGKIADCIKYFDAALKIDPKFAQAEDGLGIAYYNLGETDKAAEHLTRAYNLSGNVNELEKLQIRANYQLMAEGDVLAAIDTFKQQVASYENTGTWLSLANAYNGVGDFAHAIQAAEHALKTTNEPLEVYYELLAYSYKKANRFADAKRTIAAAQAANQDSMNLHDILFDIAIIENDQAVMQHELAWAQGKSRSYELLEDEAMLYADRGQYKRFEATMETAMTVALKDVGPDYVNSMRLDEASAEVQLGRTGQAADLLKKAVGADPIRIALLKARTEDFAPASALLRQKEQHPKNTVEHFLLLPELLALTAFHKNQPQAAIDALEPSRPYEMALPEVIELRAQAYLEAKQPEKAVAEFKKLLANQALEDPTLPRTILARLGLARAYAQQHDLANSRQEYETFLAEWSEADVDLPLLQDGKLEYNRVR